MLLGAWWRLFLLVQISFFLSFLSSSDLGLVESGLQTLTTVFSRVRGVESWAAVQELVVYICTVLDPNLDKHDTGMYKN